MKKKASIRVDLPAQAAPAHVDLLPFRAGDIPDVLIKPLVTYHDARGSLCELFRRDELASDVLPAMAYISETLPGTTRGPHEHVDQTDYFCFLGSSMFHLYLWDNRADSPTYRCHQVAILPIGQLMSVLIPPGIVHAYRNVGGAMGVVINCPNRLYRGSGKKDAVDEIRHEDDPRSPFRVMDFSEHTGKI